MGRSGTKCCVKGCSNSSRTGTKVFRVPSSLKFYQRNQWLQNAGLKEEDLPEDARFCEVHFTPDQFEKLTFEGAMGLKSNAVPTLFGSDVSQTVTTVPDPVSELPQLAADENADPEARSPLSNRNQIYQNQAAALTPVSKRRKAYSMSEDNRYSETDRLKDSLNEAFKEGRIYKIMITGLVILAIGATIQTIRDYQIFIDTGYFSTPALLVAVGSIVLIIAFFGCCGAIKENYCMLISFAALLVIVFILEIAAGISGYVSRNGTKSMLQNSLMDTVKHYGESGHNATSDLWDYMQQHLQCCGVSSAQDWVNNQPQMKNGTLPVSCCPLPVGVVGSFHCSTNASVSTSTPYQLGCQDALGSVIEGHMASVGAAALSVTAVQILAVFLAIRLAKALRNMKGTTLT